MVSWHLLQKTDLPFRDFLGLTVLPRWEPRVLASKLCGTAFRNGWGTQLIHGDHHWNHGGSTAHSGWMGYSQ